MERSSDRRRRGFQDISAARCAAVGIYRLLPRPRVRVLSLAPWRMTRISRPGIPLATPTRRGLSCRRVVVDMCLTGTSACHVSLALGHKEVSDICAAAWGVEQSHGHGRERIDWRLSRSGVGVDVAVQPMWSAPAS
jgi:hypothetical protein